MEGMRCWVRMPIRYYLRGSMPLVATPPNTKDNRQVAAATEMVTQAPGQSIGYDGRTVMRFLGDRAFVATSRVFSADYQPVLATLKQRVMRLMSWRSKQPAAIRLALVIVLFAFALLLQTVTGRLHVANSALAFYPVLLITTTLLAWKEAALVLALSGFVGVWLFPSPSMYLLSIAWVLAGGLSIAIIAVLQHLARELAAANERQTLLFKELQHRVANTLLFAVGTLELAQKRVTSSPENAAKLLGDAALRMSAAADVHRRLHDPSQIELGMDAILRDVVLTIVDRQEVRLRFDIEPITLSLDQMSTVTTMAMEVANNAQKHVFQAGFGSRLSVSLKTIARNRVRFAIKDDGTSLPAEDGSRSPESGLGTRILEGLVKQIAGTLTIRSENGTEVVIDFPIGGS
jgi:two-component sensor histidine kinase